VLETDRSHEAAAASERARESTVKLKDAVRQASKTERELKAIMEQDRANEADMLRNAVNRLEEEIGRYRSGEAVHSASAASTRDASSLEAELERNVNEVEALRRALEEQQDQATEANNALEELRALYNEAQEELEDLRAGRPSDRSSPVAGRSALGDVDSLQLELSSARAQIRSLEDEVFHTEQTRVKMLKANGDLKSQIESLQDALDKERVKSSSVPSSPLPVASTSRTPLAQPSSTPTTPTRAPPASRSHAHRRTASTLPSVSEIDDVAPGSFPPAPPPPSSSEAPFLPSSSTPTTGHRSAASRHVRQASLSLLKQRMEDELGTDDFARSPVRGSNGGDVRTRTRRVPLSNDLLWCTACSGDLYVV